MSAVLLDASFLIALLFPDHQHHEVARSWLIGLPESDSFATDAITEGALIRYSVRLGLSATDIHESLLSVHNHPVGASGPMSCPTATSACWESVGTGR